MTQMLTWTHSKTERSGNRMTQMLTWTLSKTERSGNRITQMLTCELIVKLKDQVTEWFKC
jgi:hypothetical protein